MEHVLNLNEVADYLRVSPSTIYRLIRNRQIPAFKLGRDWKFNSESLEQWRHDREAEVGFRP